MKSSRMGKSSDVRFPTTLFVIEKLDEEKKRWRTRASRASLEEAEAYAWARLTRGGGEYRVRQGHRVLAMGAGYADRWSPTERTAVWGRVRKSLGLRLAES